MRTVVSGICTPRPVGFQLSHVGISSKAGSTLEYFLWIRPGLFYGFGYPKAISKHGLPSEPRFNRDTRVQVSLQNNISCIIKGNCQLKFRQWHNAAVELNKFWLVLHAAVRILLDLLCTKVCAPFWSVLSGWIENLTRGQPVACIRNSQCPLRSRFPACVDAWPGFIPFDGFPVPASELLGGCIYDSASHYSHDLSHLSLPFLYFCFYFLKKHNNG